ncbi:porin [Variovorax sp. NFACC27]|jgi:predicted porin|uniref:Porin n=1 Tax=Variovorax paradoxus TaxID=34073 RepID=A0A5Q0M080_VARPD|nr:porin [Variovorax paradoxus]SEF19319.1 Outer membrane protein (porin) [Variovorax sp. NFACC28]SEF74135.1 Outer membrane protein (porin) [Variovorax sp. NFACC29]SFB78200.1 Outer membrane protein (porin) [Variovorax sp. NFACC26]SFG77558.1 Outer membrane protein (porin) [Variovorax sp. NFACC27]QFZ81892.1 porin [Variovorax paradoxus]
MKKSLVALAALAVAGVASAQSSVTLFGVVDASISGYSSTSRDLNSATFLNPFYLNKGSVKVSSRQLASGAYNSSRLGFRGTEDLGGGLAASFWLEAPITNDDGATGVSTFARRSTVSLSGGFGEVRLGRDYTPTFWNDTVFDPFGTVGVGTNLISTASGFNTAGGAGGFGGNPNYVRASNTIGYFLPPNLGGFYGQVQYGFSEKTKYSPGTATPNVANNSRTGRYVGGRFGYANGPLDVALAYGSSTSGDQFYAGVTNKVNTLNLGASYDFGPVKLFGEVSRVKNKVDYEVTPFVGATPDTDLTGYLLGVTVPVGAGLIRAAYSSVKYDLNQPAVLFQPRIADPKANKLAIGYVHNLSKRTALYATVARVSNKNGAALTVGGPAFFSGAGFTPKSSTGYDFGIRHAF